jgi:quercetin 2,3-dioxygenase
MRSSSSKGGKRTRIAISKPSRMTSTRRPAHTYTRIDLWDLRLNQGGVASFVLPEGRTVSVVLLKGTVQVNGDAIAREAQFVLLDRRGGGITLEANSDASLLILSGEPIEEPVSGPFVMNTADETGRRWSTSRAAASEKSPPDRVAAGRGLAFPTQTEPVR